MNDLMNAAAGGAAEARTLDRPTTPLDPQQLGPLAQAAEAQLLRAGESVHTVRSYRGALRYWAAWHQLRYHRAIALPVAEAVVVQFIVDHALRPDEHGELRCELPADLDQALVAGGFKAHPGAMALNTLGHRISVLSKLHRLAQADNPCQQPRVRELLSRVRRGHARRGDLPVKKPALTREPLEALLATCDDSLIGLRDRALLLFAWASGGRRRSEVVQATVDNTRREVDGDGGPVFLFELRVSKTNRAGLERADNVKPLRGRAARALQAWLDAAGIDHGPIFRRVRAGGHVGEPLAAAAVSDIVKKRCSLAGLDPRHSAHSLRAGFVTEAGRRQVPLGETMALTGHRSVASLVGYFRHDPAASAAARLLDDDPV